MKINHLKATRCPKMVVVIICRPCHSPHPSKMSLISFSRELAGTSATRSPSPRSRSSSIRLLTTNRLLLWSRTLTVDQRIRVAWEKWANATTSSSSMISSLRTSIKMASTSDNLSPYREAYSSPQRITGASFLHRISWGVIITKARFLTTSKAMSIWRAGFRPRYSLMLLSHLQLMPSPHRWTSSTQRSSSFKITSFLFHRSWWHRQVTFS